MPLYEFECKKCNKILEYLTSSDVARIECPYCEEWADKVISAPADRNREWAKQCRGIRHY